MEPTRGRKSAEGEPPAGFRNVVQFDEIGFRIETDHMRAGNDAGSSRRYMQHFGIDLPFRRPAENSLFSVNVVDQDLAQSQCSAARTVYFLPMMNFVNERIVLCRP